MGKYIYIIFNENSLTKETNGRRNEMLDALVDSYSKVVTLESILNKTVTLENVKAILDCTEDHYYYERVLKAKAGNEFKNKDGFTLLKTVKNNFMMRGVKLSEITMAIMSKQNFPKTLSNNEDEYEKEQQAFNRLSSNLELLMNKHHECLVELGKQIPYIVNSKRYEKAMNGEGVNLFVDSFREVKYQLVRDESVEVEPGVEKITPSDIKVLKDLHELMGNLK